MQRAAALAAFVLFALALSGCSGNGGSDDEAASQPTGSGSQTSTGPGGAVVGPVGQEPPAWAVGDSWTYTVTSGSTSEEYSVQIGVLSVEGSTYDLGVADVEEAAAAYPFHLVPMGLVDATTLGWQAHGNTVELLRFPVVDGDSWTTDLWGAPGAVVTVRLGNVTTPDGDEAGALVTADYADGRGRFLEADFGFTHGQFVRLATFFGAPVAFTEAFLHGHARNQTGFTPFHATDLVRWTANPQDPPGLPPKTFTVPADASHVLMACFLSGAVGHFSATMTIPMDTPQQCLATNSNAGATHYTSLLRTAAAGQGSASAMPLGQGTVTVEIFAIATTA